MPRATINQVAEAAGVGRSTVSRVLNGSLSVSPEARTAVEQAIKQLNYAPSRAARSLAMKHAHAIGLIIPEELDRFFGDSFFAEVMTGITSRLNESDYVLNLLVATGASDGAAERKVASFVRNGGVDGVLIVSHHIGDAFLDEIVAATPTVFAGRPEPYDSASGVFLVDADNEQGAKRAVEHLISVGRRSIATIAGPQNMVAARDRLDGYNKALQAAGLEPAIVVEGDYSAASGASAAAELVASGVSFDGLFVANDLMAIAAIAVLRDAGLRIPEDVAVVGFDDAPIAAKANPALTTIRQPSREQGSLMADILLSKLAGEEPPTITVLPTSLVIRDSA